MCRLHTASPRFASTCNDLRTSLLLKGHSRSVLPLIETTEADQAETKAVKEFMSSETASLPIDRSAGRAHLDRQSIAYELARLDNKTGSSISTNAFLANRSNGSSTISAKGSHPPIASNTFCGSVAYAAPEVLSRKSYDPKKYDMWSAGVIIFIMACFFMPFDDSDQPKMVRRQLAKKWRYPPEARISESLKEFLEAVMEPNPKERLGVLDALRHKWLKRAYRDFLVDEQKSEKDRDVS